MRTAVESRPGEKWWQPVWMTPLAIVVVGFIVFSAPPYLSLNPARSRVPATGGFAAHYPLLVAHVVFASVAMVTCCFQIWPWFRRRFVTAHRVMGRLYVFGGVVPAGLMGLTIGAVSPFGPTIRASNVLLALVWLTCTLTGFRMARQGRFVEHRRWMTRSVALTLSVITNRIWAVIFTLVFLPQLPTTFGGNETLMVQTIAGLSGWLGWVIPLLVTEWWLETTREPLGRPGAPTIPGLSPLQG